MSDVIPDYIEPMVAYRAFDHRGAELQSTASADIWEREMTAYCRRGGEHEAPDVGCDCGIWSLKRLSDVINNFGYHGHAYAKIEVYGRTFEGELSGYGPGFKSQRARIVEIYAHAETTDEQRMALVDRYGVPVLDLPPESAFDVLEKRIRQFEYSVLRFCASYEQECDAQRLQEAAAALGRVEKHEALRSREHAYAYISQGRTKRRRPICNNTWLELDGRGNPSVRLHDTHVATFAREGLALSTGNWWTVTTKDRINMACNAVTDYRVYSTGEGYGCWAAYKNGHWNLDGQYAVPPWLDGHVTLNEKGMRSDRAIEGEQMTLEGGSVPIFVASRVSKRTESKLRREWMIQNGWEIPFSNGMILPYKEIT